MADSVSPGNGTELKRTNNGVFSPSLLAHAFQHRILGYFMIIIGPSQRIYRCGWSTGASLRKNLRLSFFARIDVASRKRDSEQEGNRKQLYLMHWFLV